MCHTNKLVAVVLSSNLTHHSNRCLKSCPISQSSSVQSPSTSNRLHIYPDPSWTTTCEGLLASQTGGRICNRWSFGAIPRARQNGQPTGPASERAPPPLPCRTSGTAAHPAWSPAPWSAAPTTCRRRSITCPDPQDAAARSAFFVALATFPPKDGSRSEKAWRGRARPIQMT